MTPLDVALECAARGWAVFPCKANKTPWTKHGFKDATRDEAKLREWWGKRPDALVGVACGASGLLVVDLDVKGAANGLDEWHELVKRLGAELEDTCLVETPSGGMHVYYTAPGDGATLGNSAGKLAPGIDTRGDGGYVIAAGSTGYDYVDGHGAERVAPLPEALWRLLSASDAETAPAGAVGPEIPRGQRDSTLASLAGTMRRRGMPEPAIYAALAATNKASCKPPLADADIRRIAHSVAGYAPAEELAASPVAIAQADIAPVREPAGVPPYEGKTDTGNANRFIRLYGGRVRYCAIERKWYVYDGVRWKPDEVLVTAEWMRAALQTIFEEAARAEGEDQQKAWAKWATASMSAAKRAAALECARSDPRVAVHPSQFDADHFVLNCPNGTLDLRTLQLREHRPEDLLRKVTGAPYDAAARSVLWERVVAEALGGDAEYIDGFQRACGYCATGSTREEVFFIMHGPTRSVKSTVCDALAAALGDYVKNGVSSETWLEQGRPGATRGDLVDLDGARMAISAEATKKTAMATALIKAFTGGDPITYSRKYEQERTMTPTAKIWLHTNEVPRMPDDDEAIWRRAVFFPFAHPPLQPDPSIKARLRIVGGEESVGVLAWVVTGFAAWQQHGLDPPRASKLETAAVRVAMDPLADWWEECCQIDKDIRTTNAELRESYEKWRKAYGIKYAVGAKEWGARLQERGLEPYRDHAGRGWVGVSVVGSAVQERF